MRSEGARYELAALGWGAPYEPAFAPFGAEGLTPARVAVVHSGLYRLYSEQGELLAEVSGRLRHQAAGRRDLPAVGDWVAIRPRPAEDRATIHAVLPRRTLGQPRAGEEIRLELEP